MRTDEQCGYITYNFWSSKRELLLAGKSARVHGLSFERACIGAAADLLQHEAEAANDVVFSFLSSAEKSRRETGNNNFRNKS